MTEEEWLSANFPGRMLWVVEDDDRPSERKLNLFGAACLRRIWHLMPGPCSKLAVETLELFADGNSALEQLTTVRTAAREEGYAVETGGHQHPSVYAAMGASYDVIDLVASNAAEATAWVKVGTPEATDTLERKAQSDLLRDIFGNPFRPVVADPAWLTPTVVSIASAIYTDRAFDRLPTLADAHEEAGCTDADLLLHCRMPGDHVRGCWGVDLVLGKV